MTEPTPPTILPNSKPIETPIDYSKLPSTPPYLSFVILFILAIVIFAAIELGSQISSMRDNWAEIRCQPNVMPFASMFGHDTAENFQFCLQQIIQENTKGTTAPFAQGMMGFSSVLGNLMSSANSFRTTLASLAGGIIKIIGEFKARMTALMGRVKLTASRMKAMMYRIYGTMFAVMYMGISAQTGISNFGDTFIFKFIDAFCFVADTKVVMKHGLERSIKNIRIGDILYDGSMVEAVIQCPSNKSGLYNLDGVYVSGGHRVWSYEKNDFISVKDHPEAKETSIGADILWTLITSSREIPVKGDNEIIRFADWEEMPDTLSSKKEWDDIADSMLNQRGITQLKPRVVPITPPCIDKDIMVYKFQGGLTSIHKIQIGDWIVDSVDPTANHSTWTRVIGLCRRRVNGGLGARGTRITDGLWVKDTTGHWIHPRNKTAYSTGAWDGYQLITTSGSFMTDIHGVQTLVRDFTEVGITNLTKSYNMEDAVR